MIHLERGGWLFWVVAPLLLSVITITGTGLGLSTGRATGIAFLGISAFLLFVSRVKPAFRRPYLPVACGIQAVLGIVLLIWPRLAERAPAAQPLSSIDRRLLESPAGGTNALAQAKAETYRAAVLEFAKQDKVSVFVELDATDPRAVRKASVYVDSQALKTYDKARKEELVVLLMDRLREDFGEAACTVSARGSLTWDIQASGRRGQPLTISVISAK